MDADYPPPPPRPRPWQGRRLVVLLAAVTLIAITTRLGVWQLDRGAQKTALQARIDERARLPALGGDALAREPAQAEAQHHRPAVLTGRWRGDPVYLENRQMNGRPGFFVLGVLEFAPGDAVVVQRGWAPRDLMDRTRVPAAPVDAGPVTLTGRIAPPPARLYDFEGEAAGAIRQNLDLAAFSRERGIGLRPLSLLQTEASRPQDPGALPVDDGLLRQWPAPAVDVHKHHGYAFQWFALAALTFGLYVWFQLLRPARRSA
jgi:surfeit locus 1 family protein